MLRLNGFSGNSRIAADSPNSGKNHEDMVELKHAERFCAWCFGD